MKNAKANAKGKKSSYRRGLSSNQKARASFRHSAEWSDWRLQVIANAGGKCECCGWSYPTAKLQCHHKNLDPSKYEVLEHPEHFASLCSVCHKLVHQLQKKVQSKKRAFCGSPELKELVLRFFL